MFFDDTGHFSNGFFEYMRPLKTGHSAEYRIRQCNKSFYVSESFAFVNFMVV